MIAVMGVGHAVAGWLAEPSTTVPGRPVDLVLNWVVPILLTWRAVHYTVRVSREAGAARPDRAALQDGADSEPAPS